VFGFMRTEQSAWWNVLAWTIRNSATFAPVVAALFWPVVKRRAVLASLCTGFVSGLTWYFLGGWDPELFYLNIHPVWVGSSVNILTIIFVTLFEKQSDWQLKKADGLTIISAFIGILITFLNIIYFFLEDGDLKLFYLNINLVWLGSFVIILRIIFVTLFEKQSDWKLKKEDGLPIISVFIGILIPFLNFIYFHVFMQMDCLACFF